jgi:hypothetical protein
MAEVGNQVKFVYSKKIPQRMAGAAENFSRFGTIALKLRKYLHKFMSGIL